MKLKFGKEELFDAFGRLKAYAGKNPFVVAVIVVLIALCIVFWSILFIVLRGFLYTALALGLIVGAILIWAKWHYRKPSLRELFGEKKRLLATIKIAEQQYMKRKLSEPDFNKIFKEKQQRLIETEAMIDQQYSEEKKEKLGEELLAVETKKRHVLKGLVDEKRRLIREINLAEKSYLKRKLDAKTYQDIVQRNQQKLIEIEAQIKELYSEASVSKVMVSLKKGLSNLEDGKKAKGKKKAMTEKDEQMEIATEITEQIRKKSKEERQRPKAKQTK